MNEGIFLPFHSIYSHILCLISHNSCRYDIEFTFTLLHLISSCLCIITLWLFITSYNVLRLSSRLSPFALHFLPIFFPLSPSSPMFLTVDQSVFPSPLMCRINKEYIYVLIALLNCDKQEDYGKVLLICWLCVCVGGG